MTGSTLHKVKPVSNHFQVTPRTIYNWIRDGKIEAVRISGHIRISEEAVQKIIHPAREKKAG